MGDQISRIFGRFSLTFNIVHGKLAAFLIFSRNFEPLAEGDGKDIRIRDRSGAPDGQEASRMNRTLVPRTNEHRHTHGGWFEHGMEAALVESAAHVGDR